MRQLSLAALTVLELPPTDMIQCANELGYDGIGLRLIPATPNEPSYNFKENSPIVKECLSILRDSSVQVTDIEILRVLPETKVVDFEEVFVVGALLGAKSALIAIDDSDISRVHDNLKVLGELSTQYGIVPHVEFMPWLTINTLGKAVNLLNPLSDVNVSILVDTVHFHRSNSDLNDWARYQGLKPKYLQLCDVPTKNVKDMEEVLAQARGHRVVAGEGYISNLGDIVRTLPNDLILSLEIPEKHKTNISAKERARDVLTKTQVWLNENNI